MIQKIRFTETLFFHAIEKLSFCQSVKFILHNLAKTRAAVEGGFLIARYNCDLFMFMEEIGHRMFFYVLQTTVKIYDKEQKE